MEALARLAVRRPVAVTVLAVAFVVLGWVSWRELPLDLFPDIQSPTVLVSVRSGDRPPTEMERLYGELVEQRLFTVRGIRSVDQVARSGRLIARVTFDWGSDVDLALVDVQKAVSSIAADPDVDEVLVRRFDPRQLPVLALGLLAPEEDLDLAELRRVAKRQVAPALEQLDGVAEVRVTGGRIREVQVQLDQYLMDSHGLSLSQIESRIRAANLDINAGTLEEGDRVFLVRGMARFKGPDDVGDVVIAFEPQASGSLVPIRVRDVAEVKLKDADISDLVRVDGAEGVGLEVYKEGGSNTVSVSQAVRTALEELAADLPGVEVRLVSDEAALVEEAISDVEDAALIGIALAVLVLIFFLRSPGPTVVVAVAVPVSLFATVFAMHMFGRSLNLMTLGGLALGAGMLVDNAIVVVESIFRRRSAGDTIAEAAARGAGIVAPAIMASTLTTCVVFLPVLFVRGLAARLVSGLAFSVVVSLAASLIVAVLLIPALAAWLLPRREARGFELGTTKIEKIVSGFLRRPFTVVVVSILGVTLAGLSLLRLGSELMPPADPRQFGLRLVGPPGQRVESTARTVEVVEDILRQAAADDLRAMLSEVGRLPDDDRIIREEQTEENTALIRVRLGDGGRTAGEIVRIAEPLISDLGGVQVSWRVGSSALAQALGTSGPPIVIELSGRSLPDLRIGASSIVEALKDSEAMWNVRSSFEDGPPELRVNLDRRVADGLGVDLDMVAAVLGASLDGRRATLLTMGDEERAVMLRLEDVSRDDLGLVPLSTADGRRLTVGDVASFEEVMGAREIFRRDQRRVARVTAHLAPGFDSPAARAAALQGIEQADLVPGLRVRLAGEEEERERAFGELKWAGILAMLLVLMVLAGSFESLVHPFTVLAAVPLALIGVALVLVPIGKPIGVMVVLGLIVLAGLAVNDAILLVQAARDLMKTGIETRVALARAAAIRLRPILMTTLTTVLALVPLAFASGEAAELRAPLALTIIGGVVASTMASLFVIPCIYLLLDRIRFRR